VGAGMDVAVLGGLAVFENVVIQQYNIIGVSNGVGSTIFVGGKPMMNLTYHQKSVTL